MGFPTAWAPCCFRLLPCGCSGKQPLVCTWWLSGARVGTLGSAGAIRRVRGCRSGPRLARREGSSFGRQGVSVLVVFRSPLVMPGLLSPPGPVIGRRWWNSNWCCTGQQHKSMVLEGSGAMEQCLTPPDDGLEHTRNTSPKFLPGIDSSSISRSGLSCHLSKRIQVL